MVRQSLLLVLTPVYLSSEAEDTVWFISTILCRTSSHVWSRQYTRVCRLSVSVTRYRLSRWI